MNTELYEWQAGKGSACRSRQVQVKLSHLSEVVLLHASGEECSA